MSMEMHVLFRGKLPSKAALTRAMKGLGFPLSIAPPGGPLEQQKGYMPMRLKRDETGVEFDVFDGRAAVEEVAGDCAGEIDPGLDRSANFRWGGDESEMLCALCAAAALAKLVNGVVLEEQEGKLLTPDEAVQFARTHLEPLLEQERQEKKDRQPGTRPADIKRYVKPLLAMRSDLMLAGRALVIRPVRHVLRGAYFGRTSGKYQLNLCRYILPLHASPLGLGLGEEDSFNAGRDLNVRLPEFHPWLMDILAEDVFADIGRMTTLAEFASAPGAPHSWQTAGFIRTQISSLLLAGERERAIEFIRAFYPEGPQGPVGGFNEELWALVETDIATLCAKCRAREAETAKVLKIEHIWEPSPYPVELPADERAKVAEPAFGRTPWLSRPSWLLGEAPEVPGEVRFARDTITRNGRVMLFIPLTREEAEQRHHDCGAYTLIARLPNGHLLLIGRGGWWDRAEPPRPGDAPKHLPRGDPIIHVYGAAGTAHAVMWPVHEGGDLFYLQSIRACESPLPWRNWSCSVELEQGARRVWDDRSGETVFAETAVTPAERDLLTCALPRFGEYATLAERLRQVLRNAGYGELK